MSGVAPSVVDMTTATYESTVLLGTTSYRVVASADPDLVVELTGVDTSGALVAEGELRAAWLEAEPAETRNRG